MNATSKFKPGDRVVVKTLPSYIYGRGDLERWGGVETTVVSMDHRRVEVDMQPFTGIRTKIMFTYTFDESELELIKDFYLDKFYEQI